jgi:hypothetical protein
MQALYKLCSVEVYTSDGYLSREFEELSAYVKGHVKTAAYHPEANGEVERRHKEISMLCRLYDCDPPAVAEMWHIG